MSGANASEQAEELEVLASIFPEEFKLMDGDRSFKIYLCPNPEGGDNHVAVSLLCTMPDNYPTEGPPDLKIHVEKGLGANQADELTDVANRVALENVGAPSIFVVTEAVKEWLNDNNIAGQDGSMYSEMMRRMQQKDIQQKKQTEKAAIKAQADSEYTDDGPSPEELERIRKRQEGTAVTMESFLKWKKTFDEEMAMQELEAIRAAGPNAQNALNALTAISVGSGTGATEDMHSPEYAAALLEAFQAGDGRPTGKQYFLLNLGVGKRTGEAGEGEGECEDPDEVEDGPDAMSQAVGGGYLEGEEGDGDDDDDDSDYVDEGSDGEEDSEDGDYDDDA